MTTYGEWIAIKKKVMIEHDGYTEVHIHVPRIDSEKECSGVLYKDKGLSLSCIKRRDTLTFYLKVDGKEYSSWNSIGLTYLSLEIKSFHIVFLVKRPHLDRINNFIDKIHMLNSLSE